MELGEKIKNRRVSLGLTQEELAERADLTKGFISQVERNLTSPSVDSLTVILEALGTNISDFFISERKVKVAFSKEDYIENIDEENLSSIKWLVPNAQVNSMEPVLLKLEPNGKSKEYTPIEGENFGYITKGEILLIIDNEEYILQEGDCFYSKCEANRIIENMSNKDSEIIWITNPPSF